MMMTPRPPIAALLSLYVLAFAASSAHAQNVRIPGTTATISPPPGFNVSRTFPGLEHDTNGSRVEIVELPPAAYPELAEVFSSPKTASSRYEAEGTRITRVEPLDVNGKRAPLAIGGQRAGRRDITKYITLLGGPDSNSNTLLVTFNVTDPSALSRRDVEAAIRSITLGQLASAEDRLARSPFRFAQVAPFRLVDVLPNGVVTLAAADPGYAPTDPRPVILIERANTSALPDETAQFAETLLRSGAGGAPIEITERKTVRFVGGDGAFLAATSGEAGVMQFLRILSGGRYVVLAAAGPKDEVFAARAAVEEIARSLELR